MDCTPSKSDSWGVGEEQTSMQSGYTVCTEIKGAGQSYVAELMLEKSENPELMID